MKKIILLSLVLTLGLHAQPNSDTTPRRLIIYDPPRYSRPQPVLRQAWFWWAFNFAAL